MTENENAVNWADTPEYKLLDSIRAEAGLEQVSDVVERTKLVPEKAVMLAAQKQEFPLETWNKALERIAGSAYSPADTVIDAQLMMMDFLKHPKKKKTEMSFLKKPAKVNAEVDDKSREADETTEGKGPNFFQKLKSRVTAWLDATPKAEKMRFGCYAAGGIAVIAILIGSMTGGAKAGKGLTPALKEAAAERTTLTVGVNDAYIPPFFYIDYDGGYTGTDYKLMNEVCKTYGWDLVVKPIDWTNREDFLVSGEVDCLWSGFNSFGREDHYAWSKPYLDTSDVIVVKKNDKSIADLEGLEGKRVAAISGTTAYANLEGIGLGLTRLGCSSADQCLELLTSGDVDAIAVSKGEASLMKGVKIVNDYLDYQTYAVACRANDDVLPALLNAVFEAQVK